MKIPHAISTLLDQRPLMIAIAGPNGAGKSTFYQSHLAAVDLSFVNADDIARAMGIGSYAAANLAAALRRRYIEERKSFVFETVFSDLAGDKLAFLKSAEDAGYTVILVFVGIPNSTVSEQRVGIRILQGGHDVPLDKLRTRFPRTMANLAAALGTVQNVLVYDNGDLAGPYRQVAIFQKGSLIWRRDQLPRWFAPLLKP